MDENERLTRNLRIYLKYRGPRDLFDRQALAALGAERVTPPPEQPNNDDRQWAGRPLYKVLPRPYGHAESVIAMSTIAAPLLAGFSITCVALVLQIYERMRYPNLTVSLLSAAAVVLVMTVQYGFWARRWWWGTMADAVDAWPDAQRPGRALDVELELVEHFGAFRIWERRARRSYTIGLITLLSGLALLVGAGVDGLIQPAKGRGWQPWPLAVFAVGVAYELVWAAAAAVTRNDHKPRPDERPPAWVRHRIPYVWWKLAWWICPTEPRNAPPRHFPTADPADVT